MKDALEGAMIGVAFGMLAKPLFISRWDSGTWLIVITGSAFIALIASMDRWEE